MQSDYAKELTMTEDINKNMPKSNKFIAAHVNMRQNMELMTLQNCHLRQSISHWLASFYNSNGFLSVDRNSGIWY